MQPELSESPAGLDLGFSGGGGGVGFESSSRALLAIQPPTGLVVLQRVLKAYAAKLLGRLPKTAAGNTTGTPTAGTSEWHVSPHLLVPCSLLGLWLQGGDALELTFIP